MMFELCKEKGTTFLVMLPILVLIALNFLPQGSDALTGKCSATNPCHYCAPCDNGQCDCPDYTTGLFCQNLINDTTTVPDRKKCSKKYPKKYCQRKSTCDPSGLCDCPEDFTGVFCETLLKTADQCFVNITGNANGTNTNSTGGSAGETGGATNAPPNPCDPNPCLTHGNDNECEIDAMGNVACACETGFVGQYCEIKVQGNGGGNGGNGGGSNPGSNPEYNPGYGGGYYPGMDMDGYGYGDMPDAANLDPCDSIPPPCGPMCECQENLMSKKGYYCACPFGVPNGGFRGNRRFKANKRGKRGGKKGGKRGRKNRRI